MVFIWHLKALVYPGAPPQVQSGLLSHAGPLQAVYREVDLQGISPLPLARRGLWPGCAGQHANADVDALQWPRW